MKLFKQKARLVVINLAFLFLFLLIAEIILRLFAKGYDNAGFVLDNELHHAHKKNYAFTHVNASENEYGNIDVRYDAEGCISNPHYTNPPDASLPRIAIMGDSFLEGLQVPFENSVTGMLETQFGKKYYLKNFAVGGYSPVIYFLQLKKDVLYFQPEKLFLFLYSNDVREDQEYLLHAVYQNEKLTGIDGGMSPLRYTLIRHSFLLKFMRKYYMHWSVRHRVKESYSDVNYLEENPALSPPTLHYLDSIQLICKQNNIQLFLSCIPSKYKITHHLKTEPIDFSSQCKAWAMLHSTNYIDLVPAFETFYLNTNRSPFYQHDIHFNADGHMVLAAVMSLNLR